MNLFTAKDIQSLANAVRDQTTLATLLRDGLGWEIGEDFGDFSIEEPQIAESLPAEKCRVYVLERFTKDFPYLIALVEFEKPYQRRDLRLLLKNLKLDAAYQGRAHQTIFIVSQPGYPTISFVLLIKQTGRPVEIRTFSWNQGEAGRTVVTVNLPALSWALQPNWAPAWDVDALTEKFYALFAREFDVIRDAAKFPPVLANRETEWVQALLNRLLFVAFVERMDWMKAPGQREDEGYLQSLYRRYMARDFGNLPVKDYPVTFLGVLQLLFHEAIDNPAGCHDGSRWFPLLGKVPYLNGGLFHRDPVLDAHPVDLNDEVFTTLIGPRGLFTLTNFTVTESTPLDQNVEVDPEMLGKVFERIVNDRHKEGKYYTPRPVVAFMVDEAIKGYLVERGLDAAIAALVVDDEAIRNEVTHLDADDLTPLENLLFAIRAVDPACGSGAYLLGMLQKLERLVDVARLGRGDLRDHYEAKLKLLQHCVYGVDKDETAVRIARLRLWLSLAVENKGQIPDPLPNLDFRVMAGDSLSAPVAPRQRDLFFTKEVEDFANAKSRYFHPAPGDDRDHIRAEVDKHRKRIADYLSNTGAKRGFSPDAFDWEIEFAEVFAPSSSVPDVTIGGSLNLGLAGGQGELVETGPPPRAPGFDIVVANPPYVNAGQLLQSVGKTYKDALIRAFPETGAGSSDLLLYFFERAMALLRPGGQIAFVTSNKWLKSGYGQNLRSFLARKASLRHLLDYNDNEIFLGVIAYPLVTIGQRGGASRVAESEVIFTPVPRGRPPYPDPMELIAMYGHGLPSIALDASGEWRLELGLSADKLAIMRTRGRPLGEVVKGKINRGIVTGLNEVKIGSDGKMYGKVVPSGVRVVRKEGVFVIDGAKRAELIAQDPRSAEIIKPLAIGRDIKRWQVDRQDRWLVFTRRGINIEDFPAIKGHLDKYRERLEPRPKNLPDSDAWPGRKAGSYQWCEIQDEIAYFKEFEDVKIVYQEIATHQAFAWCDAGIFTNNKVFQIFAPDLYLLGILMSSPAWEWYQQVSTKMVGGALAMQTPTVETLPIPDGTSESRADVISNVRAILDRKAADPKADVSDLERINNALVAALYGLPEE